MKKPTSVKIGSHRYHIQWFPEAKIDGRYVGVCFHRIKVIKIASDLPKRMLAQTLIHEIMHGIYYEYGLVNSEMSSEDYVAGMCSEETAVNGISLGLTTVLVDNPRLLKYINWCLR